LKSNLFEYNLNQRFQVCVNIDFKTATDPPVGGCHKKKEKTKKTRKKKWKKQIRGFGSAASCGFLE